MFTKNWYTALGLLMVNTYGTYKGYDGSTKAAYQPTYNALNLVSNSGGAKSPYLGNVLTSLYSNGGVIFGSGTTPPSLDDYKLSSSIISTITASAPTPSVVTDDNGVSVTTIYSLTNTGTEDITVGEVGLIASLYSSSSTEYYLKALLERTVLDTPVTIPAGGIGQVTYTIRMNYPTV